MLPRTQPRSLEELAIEIAIIRPGPIVGGAVHPYVSAERMQQREAKEGEEFARPYDHPLLEPALKETLGVILYQDQVLQVAVALAGIYAGRRPSRSKSPRRKADRRGGRGLELYESFRAGREKRAFPTKSPIWSSTRSSPFRSSDSLSRTRLRLCRLGLPIGVASLLLPGGVCGSAL